jgi:isopenicillin-N epimerase
MLSADSRGFFLFEPGLTYLNHGGFGATPKDVLNVKLRLLADIEKNPAAVFQHDIRALWHGIAETIARRFSLGTGALAIVDNVTDGIVAVLRSLSFEAGDEILLTSMSPKNKVRESRWPLCASPIPIRSNSLKLLRRP